MSLWQVVVLGIIQGLTELLPVSSSAHVVVAEKLMGLDPSSPQMTLLLVMLHTGTMFAVIVFFWGRWRRTFSAGESSGGVGLGNYILLLVIATVITGVIGEALIKVIEKVWMRGTPHAEVELLFSHLGLIAPALALVGILILAAGILAPSSSSTSGRSGLNGTSAALIGAVQGLCLPFRGFSRSGATISTAMLAGVEKASAEDFSFALAVILTPPAVAREALRLIKAEHAGSGVGLASAAGVSLLGFFCAFLAGLVALKWLSKWLETGRWYLFGIYCLVAAAGVAILHHSGY
jgi:undecaprenyl-diphosphatase